MTAARTRKRIRSRAPVRICDLGGWTDTKFVGHGYVLNFAVDLFAHCLLSQPPPRKRPVTAFGYRSYQTEADTSVRIQAPDINRGVTAGSVQDIEYDGSLDLLKAAIKRMGPERGIEALVWADAPAGCGVGTSASVAVALVEGLAAFLQHPLAQHEVAQIAQRLETEELGLECGVQDQFASAYGGICFMEVNYPDAVVSQVPVREDVVRELNERFLLVYTGQARLSDNVHRGVIANYESGDPTVRGAVRTLLETPQQMREALLRVDFKLAAEAINANWEAQKALHPSISTDLIEETFRVAFKHGATAGKANGAGGGGSITFLVEPGHEYSVRHALTEIEGLQILPCNICFEGARSWVVP